MKLQSVEDLLVHHVKSLRGAEKQISRSFSRMSGSSLSPTVRANISSVEAQSRTLKVRLTQVADDLDHKCGLRGCDPVAGLLEEARCVLGAKSHDRAVCDLALTSVVQRLIRYRMVAYAQATGLAERSGNSRSAELLHESLQDLLRADTQTEELINDLLVRRSDPRRSPACSIGRRPRNLPRTT